MLITSLGSCRQHSLYTHFQVTHIQEALTYPHYTKEIIQAIEFCKGISTIPESMTTSVFRSGILGQQTLHYKEFESSFNASDMIVMEIASRIAYTYKGYYVHHILTEPEYGCIDISNIEVRELTDEEIEADIWRIKELLSDKKIVISSHVYTRTHGKRYDLVVLLRSLCLKYNIPFFDPMQHLVGIDLDTVFVKEEGLCHYTPIGHQIIGEKYRQFIACTVI